MRYLAAICILVPGLAFAHPGHGMFDFSGGVVHPMSGWDHVVAMVAMGVWAAMVPSQRAWSIPAGFLFGMLLGGAAGMAGLLPPGLETMVAASALTASLLVAFALRVPMLVQGLLAAGVAMLHGLAHGAELPLGALAYAYAAGFMLATTGLIALGWWLGRSLGSTRHQRGLGVLLAIVSGTGLVA